MTDREDTIKPLPKEIDFDPYGGCLDAQCAWKNFGGLSVDEAYAKFCECPDTYQEDFMFMGGTAFSYYFPVVERYIYETHVDDESEYGVAAMWILAHCIKQQFAYGDTRHVNHLRASVLSLASHVRSNLSLYCVGSEEQQEVDTAWGELQSLLMAADRAG